MFVSILEIEKACSKRIIILQNKNNYNLILSDHCLSSKLLAALSLDLAIILILFSSMPINTRPS